MRRLFSLTDITVIVEIFHAGHRHVPPPQPPPMGSVTEKAQKATRNNRNTIKRQRPLRHIYNTTTGWHRLRVIPNECNITICDTVNWRYVMFSPNKTTFSGQQWVCSLTTTPTYHHSEAHETRCLLQSPTLFHALFNTLTLFHVFRNPLGPPRYQRTNPSTKNKTPHAQPQPS